ncbi:MAG: asparagine synthase (glutamine-hydrolyzing) [Alphaproteobacteria bacterium]
MCGIAGCYRKNGEASATLLDKMLRQLRHRGPDASGKVTLLDGTLSIGMNRLAIHDLGTTGEQPFVSLDGRYILIFNGEIYNFRELKKKISHKYNFVGQSDTEVLFALLQIHGVETTLRQLDGMFAFAFFDNAEQKLTLVRDPIGEKPLFVYQKNNEVAFASELKAFGDGVFDLTIDEDSLIDFMKLGYTVTPDTIYKNIKQLSPGSLIEFSFYSHEIKTGISVYKKYNEIAVSSTSESEILSKVEAALSKSVLQRLDSERPVGVFLSGGIDSALVAYKAQEYSQSSIKTYSIGFDQPDYDESGTAAEIAKQIGANHYKTILGPSEYLNFFESTKSCLDEPIGDPAFFATGLLSKHASADVGVVLTGDGADELFFGYGRHTKSLLFNIIRYVNALGGQNFDSILSSNAFLPIVRAFLGPFGVQIDHRVSRLRSLLQHKSIHLNYEALVSPIYPVDFETHVPSRDSALKERVSFLDPTLTRWLDFSHYLPDNTFRKTDRATMSYSIEARAPFVSRELVELALASPHEMHTRHNTPKFILRQLAAKYFGQNFSRLPKKGFGIPLDFWLRGELRDWCQSSIEAFIDLQLPQINNSSFSQSYELWQSSDGRPTSLSGASVWRAAILAQFLNLK